MMKRLLPFALPVSFAAATACSASDFAEVHGGSSGFGGSVTASSGTGAAGGGGLTGSGGEGLKAFSYTEYCGDGCLPEESDAPDPCEGAGGGGGGEGELDCKLTFDQTTQETLGMCTAPGTQVSGGPCITSADCAADHGCVNEAGNAVCRQYCCGALEDCPEQLTFCDLRPLIDAAPSVPVCALVEDCTLLDATTCTDGKSCTIVRQDGTTSCVTPGPGNHGDPCPCAADHVCATGLNQCLRLCRTAMPEQDCPPEAPKCQGGASIYPPGFGVCVEN